MLTDPLWSPTTRDERLERSELRAEGGGRGRGRDAHRCGVYRYLIEPLTSPMCQSLALQCVPMALALLSNTIRMPSYGHTGTLRVFHKQWTWSAKPIECQELHYTPSTLVQERSHTEALDERMWEIVRIPNNYAFRYDPARMSACYCSRALCNQSCS